MSTNIEPWEASIPLCPTESEMSQAMEAEITKLRARTHADAKLIAEQNRLAKERQEWALHTNEVIRDLRAALALAQAPSAPVARQDDELLHDAYSALLWLLRRLPSGYQTPPHIAQVIKLTGRAIGSDPAEFIAERAALSVKAGETSAPSCRNQGGMCACRSGGSFGGCALERAAPTPPTTGEA